MAIKPLIRVIGSLNKDVVIVTPRMPDAGETLTATSFHVSVGGKGANQAVACGRAAYTSRSSQDVEVEMIGAVGAADTHYAALLKPVLEESGTSTRGVIELDGVQTGTSTILVDQSARGENRIMFVPGANYEGMRDHEYVLQLATISQFLPSLDRRYPDVVLLQGEIPRSTTIELLKHFNDSMNKTCAIFNPAPMFPEGIPPAALRDLAFLIVNETECAMLVRTLPLEADLSGQVEKALTVASLDEITHQIQRIVGVRNIIVTLGSRGAYFADAYGLRGLVETVKVKDVVDTTAAGDTFAGFFATALARHISSPSAMRHFDMANAISNANLAAAKCVQRSGSMSSMPFGWE